MKRVFSKAWCVVAFIAALIATGVAQPLVAQPYVEVYLDYLLRPVKGNAAFSRVERLYHTADSGWRAHRFIYPGMQPDALYYLDDTATRRRNGPYFSYYSGSAEAPGRLRQQCFYMADTLHGWSYSWYQQGQPASRVHYRRGHLSDSVQYWHENGEPEQLGLLDSTDTGRFEEYFSTGSLLQQGQLLAGRKHGSWTVFDEQGRRTMAVQFAADSLLRASCFDSTGQPANGPCIYQREASFAGGFGGWRRFLEQNFQYPKEAIRNGIEGAVRFLLTVEPDGSVADIEIVASPYELLTKEVRRLMSRTPKWEPAIRFNKPVKTKASQVVFFRLQ